MIGLILETSTERSMLAAFNDAACLFREDLPYGIQNSHLLLPELQNKLQEHVLKAKNLEFIAVGVGPGSYTGIRVGATIGKTLAFTLEIPLIGICTLETFVPENDGAFAAVIDANIGGVYLLTGVKKGEVIEMTKTPRAYSLEEAANILEEIPTIVTPNAEKIRPKLEALKPGNNWDWQNLYPNAGRMLSLAQRKMNEGNLIHDQSLELMYMRKTQAEIEKERKDELRNL